MRKMEKLVDYSSYRPMLKILEFIVVKEMEWNRIFYKMEH